MRFFLIILILSIPFSSRADRYFNKIDKSFTKLSMIKDRENFEEKLVIQKNNEDTVSNGKLPISLVYTVGLSKQKSLLGEFDLTFAKIDNGKYKLWGPFLGVETNFNFNNWILGPKAGFEYGTSFFILRGSFINYFDKEGSDLRMLPEAGISLLGILNFTYGYSIPLTNFESNKLGNHRIGFFISLSD